MLINAAPHYHAARVASPFTHLLQTSIPSLGIFYDNLRVPDLLLSVHYRLGEHGDLIENPQFLRFTFQPDGPSDADLNFPHSGLMPKVVHQVCTFSLRMDIVFGAGVTKKVGGTVDGNLGVEKAMKSGVEAKVEMSKEAPGMRTILHAIISGVLSAREHTLEAWGDVQGMAQQHRSY